MFAFIPWGTLETETGLQLKREREEGRKKKSEKNVKQKERQRDGKQIKEKVVKQILWERERERERERENREKKRERQRAREREKEIDMSKHRKKKESEREREGNESERGNSRQSEEKERLKRSRCKTFSLEIRNAATVVKRKWEADRKGAKKDFPRWGFRSFPPSSVRSKIFQFRWLPIYDSSMTPLRCVTSKPANPWMTGPDPMKMFMVSKIIIHRKTLRDRSSNSENPPWQNVHGRSPIGCQVS